MNTNSWTFAVCALAGLLCAVAPFLLPPGPAQSIPTWFSAAGPIVLVIFSSWRSREFPWISRSLGYLAAPTLLIFAAGLVLTAFGQMLRDSDLLFLGNVLIGSILALLAYFLPTIIARLRLHSKVSAILALDALLGFIFIGWALALVWALTEDNRTAEATPSADLPPTAAESSIRDAAHAGGRAVGVAVARGIGGSPRSGVPQQRI